MRKFNFNISSEERIQYFIISLFATHLLTWVLPILYLSLPVIAHVCDAFLTFLFQCFFILSVLSVILHLEEKEKKPLYGYLGVVMVLSYLYHPIQYFLYFIDSFNFGNELTGPFLGLFQHALPILTAISFIASVWILILVYPRDKLVKGLSIGMLVLVVFFGMSLIRLLFLTADSSQLMKSIFSQTMIQLIGMLPLVLWFLNFYKIKPIKLKNKSVDREMK